MPEQQQQIHEATAFEVLGNSNIRITFEDGAIRMIDFTDTLLGELLTPLER